MALCVRSNQCMGRKVPSTGGTKHKSARVAADFVVIGHGDHARRSDWHGGLP
jgi:hypothetical protein